MHPQLCMMLPDSPMISERFLSREPQKRQLAKIDSCAVLRLTSCSIMGHGGIFMRPRAPISLVRARLILPLIQTLIVLRIEARKWLINSIIGRFVLPYMRQRYAADAMAADRVTYDRLKANRFLPDRVFVQISRRCNLTCSMCGWQIWKRNKGFMSVDLFKRVIVEMTANGIRNLEFTSTHGEPLQGPH